MTGAAPGRRRRRRSTVDGAHACAPTTWSAPTACTAPSARRWACRSPASRCSPRSCSPTCGWPTPPTDVLAVNAVGDAFAFVAPFGDGWYRIFAWDRRHQLPDTAPVTLDEIREVTRRALGTDFGLQEARWMSRFHSDERQAPHYRVGRVFLAGDAAHVHSPAGGQGMNTGLQDAANLGWKLAAAVAGLGAGRAARHLRERAAPGRPPRAAQQRRHHPDGDGPVPGRPAGPQRRSAAPRCACRRWPARRPAPSPASASTTRRRPARRGRRAARTAGGSTRCCARAGSSCWRPGPAGPPGGRHDRVVLAPPADATTPRGRWSARTSSLAGRAHLPTSTPHSQPQDSTTKVH